MNKQFFTIIFSMFLSLTAAAQMEHEADNFISNMDPAQQGRQRDAINQAISGDNTALMAVRNARNSKPTFPANVKVEMVTPTLRLYTNIDNQNEDKPLLVYLHGGGWTIGSINSCARFCSEVCVQSGASVLAVDYRLAPEHPYPAPLDDCIDAVCYAQQQASAWGCSPNKIAVGGDSSGGNLAVATALKTDNVVAKLVLFYPVTKAYADGSESWKKYGTGLGLDADLMEAFNNAYLKDCRDADLEFISVAHNDDNTLKKLPQTLLVAAERDILHDQGKEFAERLQSIGVDIERIVFPGTVHLFITVPGQETAFKKAVKCTTDFLKK